MLIVGEVQTGLLQSSTSLPALRCEQLLALFRGDTVSRFARPIAYAVSPDLLTGVDCRLPTASGAHVRGIGTVVHRASITGGHVLQGSALAHLSIGAASHRLPWSHYLARPGEMEIIGRADWDDLAGGFAGARPAAPVLDLGAISGRTMDRVQASSQLDRSPPFRAARTRLRWVAGVGDGPPEVRFSIEGDQIRTLRLTCHADHAPLLAALCEDLALHDWLLTTLLVLIERSRIGAGEWKQMLDRLRPAIDHLLHLWMPAARVDQQLLPLWEFLERRPGFSRQWRASVDRIRDQLAVTTMTLLSTGDRPVGDRPGGDRPGGDRSGGERLRGDRPGGGRPGGTAGDLSRRR